MTYEVYLPGYGTMAHTDSVRCVDNMETIEEMARAGHKFKVDGKVVAKSNVHQAVADSLGISVAEVRKQIKQQQQWGEECNETAYQHSEDGRPIDEGVSVMAAPVTTVEKVDDRPKRKVTRIRCVELDTVYKNMTEAGKALGIDPAYVSDSVRLNKEVKGYHFERIE